MREIINLQVGSCGNQIEGKVSLIPIYKASAERTAEVCNCETPDT